jgi:hypothetical protein
MIGSTVGTVRSALSGPHSALPAAPTIAGKVSRLPGSGISHPRAAGGRYRWLIGSDARVPSPVQVVIGMLARAGFALMATLSKPRASQPASC